MQPLMCRMASPRSQAPAPVAKRVTPHGKRTGAYAQVRNSAGAHTRTDYHAAAAALRRSGRYPLQWLAPVLPSTTTTGAWAYPRSSVRYSRAASHVYLGGLGAHPDRKSTRLNSSHVAISYA